MTLLEIVQQACRELALPIPNAAAASSDQQAAQMFGLMNALGQELRDTHDFQVLVTTHTFTTDGTGEDDLPSDFHRMLDDTQWDRTNRWALVGPMLPSGWQWLISSQLASIGPRVRWRVRGDDIEYYPTTDSGNTFAFEYITQNWVTDGDDSSAKDAFTKDTDTCVFRDRLMVNGLKFKFLAAKGLDTAAAERDFGLQLEAQMAAHGAPTLNLSGSRVNRFLDLSNVPDSGIGQ